MQLQMERRTMTKPDYRVPLMSEIADLPWNGFNAISTFSGCGGSSLGYKMAGFRVLWASEFIPAAQQTYRANHPKTILDTRDIRQVKAEEILAAIGMKSGELDLFDGSPPCASFSTAGSREAGWGKVKKYSDGAQRTDDLFYEFIRLVRGIQPKVFVAENVSGLVKGTAKGYFLEILAAMKASGYRVTCRVLDAQWLGVPQQRQRTIFVGVREDLNREPVHPKPLSYRYSIKDALPIGVKAEAETDISRYAIFKELGTMKAGDAFKAFPRWSLSSMEKPNPCVTVQEGGHMIHPTAKRKFTIAELRRICAFPDDFILLGTYAQQWERLGRAVPPVMMSYVAATVRDEILRKI
jgi:DNA (cytosine-5)-methyltransferase 1